jgi:hypothetical protein
MHILYMHTKPHALICHAMLTNFNAYTYFCCFCYRDLKDNSISDLNSTSFPKNCSVDTLVLTGNRISRVSESWLTLLPQLKSLKLNKNAFRSLVAFPCLPNLEFL